MKNLFALTAAAVVATATSAYAIEIGGGLVLDSTTTIKYEVEAADYTADQEFELSYTVMEGLKAFAYTETNLRDINFTGVSLGGRYTVNDNFELESAVELDSDLNYDELYIQLEISF
jgi:long-subunit fatty acid transport protein